MSCNCAIVHNCSLGDYPPLQPTPYETLMAAFLDTPEMADWDAFVSATRQQLAAGAASVTVPAAFLGRIIDEISTSPMMFMAVKDHWNRHCDEERTRCAGMVLVLMAPAGCGVQVLFEDLGGPA